MGRFIRYSSLKKLKNETKPGDIFVWVNSENTIMYTYFIIDILDCNNKDFIHFKMFHNARENFRMSDEFINRIHLSCFKKWEKK